jgi:hypothetical protein
MRGSVRETLSYTASSYPPESDMRVKKMPVRLFLDVVLGFAILLVPLSARADCHHRRLDKVTDGGRMVQLDDGSQWQVSDYDQSDAQRMAANAGSRDRAIGAQAGPRGGQRRLPHGLPRHLSLRTAAARCVENSQPLSLRGAQRGSNPLPDERTSARQAGDCFVAARLAMTGSIL